MLPSVPEHRRIASILDQADELRAKRRRTLALLDDLADSIFTDMFLGRSNGTTPSEFVALGDVLRFSSGKFLLSKSMNTSGGIPVYGGNGVNGHHDEFMFERSKIVVGRVGAYCGVVHVTAAKSWVTDNAMIVDWNPGQFDIRYVAAARLVDARIACPKISEQLLFDQRSAQLKEDKRMQSAHLAHLDELFASLQQRVFAGEL